MIYIENETEEDFDFQDPEAAIRNAVQAVLADKQVPENVDVNVIIVTSEDIRKINSENRNIDSVTDVLSFPYFEYEIPGEFTGELMPDEENILGDIVLCAERVKTQAEEYGHSQRRELSFLTVHSMLHLLGYDHMEEPDRLEMEAEQRRFMEILGTGR